MNFTREPILETIIAAKEGFKLRLKSTKHEGAAEYLVDAIEVVSFGTTFFYRSGEPAHTFFVPAQDFEIVQVKQARMVLKTPSDKTVKIAGGADGSKKSNSDKSKKKKSSKSVKAPLDKEESKKEDPKAPKSEGSDGEVKKDEKTPEVKEGEKESKPKKAPRSRGRTKSAERKPTTKDKKKVAAESSDEVVQPSMFSHLLRPPEALISDSIQKYQHMMEESKEEEKKGPVNITETPPEINTQEMVSETSTKNVIDDPNLTSEPPKPFETLADAPEVEKPLSSLKEKMKKVLAPALKSPAKKEEKEEKKEEE